MKIIIQILSNPLVQIFFNLMALKFAFSVKSKLDKMVDESIERNKVRSGRTLIYAAKLGNLEEVKEALAQGADIHADDDSALIYSAKYGHLEVVKYLVGQGANIHADDDFALCVSAQNGHLEVVQYLAGQGANIHADNDLALRWSASHSHLEIVQYLIGLRCDPQKIIDFGFSDETIKNWAERYINARDMKNKLETDLQPKTTTKTGRIKI